ncbi:MAG: hypothetical protein ACYDH8_16345, partial [Syntrophales bacterium]
LSSVHSVLPAVRPERVAPAKPNEQKKAVQPAVPARVSPVKPAQPEQPAVRPERAAPAKQKATIKPPEKDVEKRKEQKRLEEEEGKPRS